MRTAVSNKPTVIALPRAVTLNRADLYSLCLLLFGFVSVLLLVPPVHAYPMDDDWIYAQTISGLLNWSFKPHDESLTGAFSHNVWGALFSSLFGQSFTI